MTFIPQRVAISSITQALPAVVTTAQNHNLFTGGIVRLHVPQNYGMFQLNQQQFSITVLSSNSFSLQYTQSPVALDVDSRNYPAFTTPSKPGATAEVLSIGAGATLVSAPAALVNSGVCVTNISDAVINNSTVPIPF